MRTDGNICPVELTTTNLCFGPLHSPWSLIREPRKKIRVNERISVTVDALLGHRWRGGINVRRERALKNRFARISEGSAERLE